MHKIENTPAPCANCGKGNTPNARGERPQFVDFERDVNWNDPLILCEDCICKAGSMVGMASTDALRAVNRELNEFRRLLHEAEAEVDSMRRRARRVGVEFAGRTSA